ncbi:outer membrane murein-binding lipoprotein Lpp [Pararhizobium capsulatum DSM 1112]|uniref:Outer membrane murein-binding lipoprotein Lpp n=1 Tax=Pararhizobium capsulatum DSM 1112 TaxID=1121113 RepID=A0ABU0BTP7_9HYPH|nr:SHOCT domain-containing protein [Pararhizobium capsulatum]MDQ0320227.1 outer membrane murein-binding lipoprotein Lpp [Pararhizobium capsulatum DSM 1112]
MRHSLKVATRLCTLTACAVSMALVAGCSSTTLDDRSSTYTTTMARPVAADVYPVIEGKRPAAAVQMSNDEAASLSARLTSLSHARSSGQISEAEYQRRLKELQALAANHGSDTLKEIQN